jgi:hypothetical protein
MKTELVLDALEQALHERPDTDGLIHHCDRGRAIPVHSIQRASG